MVLTRDNHALLAACGDNSDVIWNLEEVREASRDSQTTKTRGHEDSQTEPRTWDYERIADDCECFARLKLPSSCSIQKQQKRKQLLIMNHCIHWLYVCIR